MSDLAKAVTRALFPLVARHLSGRDCEVIFQKPYIKGTIGLTARSRTPGAAVIYLDPTLDSETMLRTFLHECGHCLKHYQKLPLNFDHEQPPESYRIIDRERFKVDNQADEREAESMMHYWMHFSELETEHNSLSARLAALLRWRSRG